MDCTAYQFNSDDNACFTFTETGSDYTGDGTELVKCYIPEIYHFKVEHGLCSRSDENEVKVLYNFGQVEDRYIC